MTIYIKEEEVIDTEYLRVAIKSLPSYDHDDIELRIGLNGNQRVIVYRLHDSVLVYSYSDNQIKFKKAFNIIDDNIYDIVEYIQGFN